MASVASYPPGTQPSSLVPGDFTLHRATTNKARAGETTMLGKLIQAGERARYGNSDWARWTHCALVVSEDGRLVEALESGVKETHITKYRGADYIVVRVDANTEQRMLATRFARAHVGDSYGILNFIALAFQALFGWSLGFHMDRQLICSGLVARATEKYIAAYPLSPENMLCADLARYWQVSSGEPSPRLGWFGRVLNVLLLPRELLRR